MGKKSKRRLTGGTAKAAKPEPSIPVTSNISNVLDLKDALRSCSKESFESLCKEFSSQGGAVIFGKDYDPATDDRLAMEEKLLQKMPNQFPPAYMKGTMRQMKAAGGMHVTAVEARGSVKSFMYTTGFSSLPGGSELLMEGVHRTAMTPSLFNHLYALHKAGTPVWGGHTANCQNIVYMIKAPESKHEATLLKATKTLDATRLYGLTGYDILCVIPIAVRVDNQKDFCGLTKQDKAKLMNGEEVDGYLPIRSKQLRKCAYCHVTENEMGRGKFLQKCAVCESSLYCNWECRKADWKAHKKHCKPLGDEDGWMEQVADRHGFDKKQKERFEKLAKTLDGME